MNISTPKAKVGADIGGTFTDLVMIDTTGSIVRKKVPSTTGAYSQGILNALEQALQEAEGDASSIAELVHGTTVATNAVLELKGARVGLLTTKGFRDVLELRRLRMPVLYKLDWEKPPALVERFYRREIDERMGADGQIVAPIDLNQVEVEARWLLDHGAEALAIVFLNSYKNPKHEIAAAERLRSAFPNVAISVSVEILPEMQEYERTSTAVVNAYVQPKVRDYVELLTRTLKDGGVSAPVRIMQSSGGIISAQTAMEFPVQIIESGPAAGVIACQRLMSLAGYHNVISFDMGGTTAKASLVEDGKVKQATEYEVGGGVSSGSRLSRGGGYVIRVPSIDISEVGAGGGSLVSFDKAGGIRVGPESAGSVPGPVAYQNGNSVPTVTDANIVLGYINPTALAGGSLRIDGSLSRTAIEEQVAMPLGLESAEEAAFGIHAIANATMIRALRSVTIERGRDPTEFVMCAFGGSGPIHAANIARAADIKRVVIPPSPGLFSAFGLLLANIEHHMSQTMQGRLDRLPLTEVESAFAHLEKQALHAAEEPLELVNIRVIAEITSGVAADWLQKAAAACEDPPPSNANRQAYFGREHGSFTTPILSPSEVTLAVRQGPAIIEAYDSTIVIPPQSTFCRDGSGNIVIDLIY